MKLQKSGKICKEIPKKQEKTKIYTRKSKKFKQLLKTPKTSHYLCSLGRYLKNYYAIGETITTSGKIFKRKHNCAVLYIACAVYRLCISCAVLYIANLEIAKEIVIIFLKLYYSFFHNPLRRSIDFPWDILAGRKGKIRLKQDWVNYF